MDYSAANPAMWNFIIQMGAIALAVLLANILRRRVPFIRKGLMPVSVMAGFILLLFKVTGIFVPDNNLLEMLVYHCIALGFISMSCKYGIISYSQVSICDISSTTVIIESNVS